jgi:cardiolipin synthase
MTQHRSPCSFDGLHEIESGVMAQRHNTEQQHPTFRSAIQRVLTKVTLINQILVIVILLIAQVLWWLALILWLSRISPWLQTALWIFSAIVALTIIRTEPKPEVKLAWLAFILLAPIMGGLLYFLVGGGHAVISPLHKRLLKSEKLYSTHLHQKSETLETLSHKHPHESTNALYLINTENSPVYENTSTRYFPMGEDAWPKMLEDLESAQHFIFLEYFIVEEGEMWDSILEILERKVAAGVEVRMLYDDFGTLGLVPRDFFNQMRKKGIQCYCFNRFIPVLSIMMNNRDHRKILSIDGRVAYTGGINLADEYVNRIEKHGRWKDTAIRLEGDAVWSFTLMFLQTWQAVSKRNEDVERYKISRNYQNSSAHADDSARNGNVASAGTSVNAGTASSGQMNTGYVQPYYGTPLNNEFEGEGVYLNLINAARKKLYICTPYLIVDAEMIGALRRAAQRGVRVCIVTPSIPDHKIVHLLTRSYYRPLLDAGVEIWEYTPGFIHAKLCLCDDVMATVGSVNFDYRSLMHHFECGTVLYGTDSVKNISSDIEETLSQSTRIRREDTHHGFVMSCFISVLQLVSPLM